MIPKRQRYILLGALAAALVMTGLFGMRVIHSARHFRGDTAEEIRPWMPIRYIARSHDVPPHVLLESLGMTLDSPGSRAPLDEIARQQNRPVSELITTLDAAIKDFHAAPPGHHPPPPPPPTPVARWGRAHTV